jgi:hypothetical protein
MIDNKQLSEQLTTKLRTSVTGYFYGLKQNYINLSIANPVKYTLGLTLDILPIVKELTGNNYELQTMTIGIGVVVLELRQVTK